jgi:hypothetical protein
MFGAEQLKKENLKIIIFHGHIHIIPICEDREDNEEFLNQDF